MWDFKPQFKSFICLETFITEKNSNRTMYIINLESKQNIRIGRGHDSDVRVSDISVSRFHAMIRKDRNGSFYLEDNNSKFGSLVLVQVPKLRILKNSSLSIQIGRTMLTFDIKKPFSLFSCFCSQSSQNEKPTDYQALNSKCVNFENCNFIKTQCENYDEEDDDALSSLKASIKLASQEVENQEIPVEATLNFKETLISHKNTFSFKVIEAEEEKENQLEIEAEELNPDNEQLQNEMIAKSSDYRVNRNRIYLERAKTNIDFARHDIQSLKEKIKKDLDSLRNFEAEQSPIFTDKDNLSNDQENPYEDIIIPHQEEVNHYDILKNPENNHKLQEIELKEDKIAIDDIEKPKNFNEEEIDDKFLKEISQSFNMEKEQKEKPENNENSKINSSEEKKEEDIKIQGEIAEQHILLTDFNIPLDNVPPLEDNIILKESENVKSEILDSNIPQNDKLENLGKNQNNNILPYTEI